MNGSCACGFFLARNLDWYQANQGCKSKGARLPEINSTGENNDIFHLKVSNSKFFRKLRDKLNLVL